MRQAETNALNGINLTIKPGETVALVGQTGAGKSTLVKLIARFYDVTGGAVLVDGADVRDYDLPSYRHQLGVVPQESYLFAGTVRDSIAYARPEATDAEVEAAARATGAHDMIMHLPRRLRPRGRPSAAGTCRPASGSSSRWPGRSWPTPPSCCSTRRPPRSTWPPRQPSTAPSAS